MFGPGGSPGPTSMPPTAPPSPGAQAVLGGGGGDDPGRQGKKAEAGGVNTHLRLPLRPTSLGRQEGGNHACRERNYRG